MDLFNDSADVLAQMNENCDLSESDSEESSDSGDSSDSSDSDTTTDSSGSDPEPKRKRPYKFHKKRLSESVAELNEHDFKEMFRMSHGNNNSILLVSNSVHGIWAQESDKSLLSVKNALNVQSSYADDI